MARFHMYKKVITWEQLFKFCKNRRMSRFCSLIEEDCPDKECKPNNDTKARCPIWNCQLENLAMLRPIYSEIRSNGNHGEEKHSKGFRDENEYN